MRPNININCKTRNKRRDNDQKVLYIAYLTICIIEIITFKFHVRFMNVIIFLMLHVEEDHENAYIISKIYLYI